MFSYLYEWIRNISFYMVMVTMVMHMIPGSGYKRYIRFFTGLVLVVMLTDPFLKILGMGDLWQNLYENPVYQEQVKKMEEASQYLSDTADGTKTAFGSIWQEEGIFGEDKGIGTDGGADAGERRSQDTGADDTDEDDALIHVDEIKVGR